MGFSQQYATAALVRARSIHSENAICEGLILFWFRRWYQRLKGAVLLRALIDCEEVQQQQQQQQQHQQLIDISRLAATTGKMSCCHNVVIVTPSLASNWLHIIADAAAAPQPQVRWVKCKPRITLIPPPIIPTFSFLAPQPNNFCHQFPAILDLMQMVCHPFSQPTNFVLITHLPCIHESRAFLIHPPLFLQV